eukprot:gene6362-9288_t
MEAKKECRKECMKLCNFESVDIADEDTTTDGTNTCVTHSNDCNDTRGFLKLQPKDHVCKYERLYHEVMSMAPPHIYSFSSPTLAHVDRERVVSWMRDPDNIMSPMSLQIRYAFSIPTIDALISLKQQDVRCWISCGSGTGYWEMLMQNIGMQVLPFDRNTTYREEMRYTNIHTAGPEYVEFQSTVHDGIFIAWPDVSEESTFGIDCLKLFRGNLVAHIGELRGDTLSDNPWGQSSSALFQDYLTSTFRLYKRIELPRWPYQRDSLTLWRRVTSPVNCDGGMFVSMLPMLP